MAELTIDQADLSPIIIESSYTYIQLGFLLYFINNVVIIFILIHINKLHKRTTLLNLFLHDNISMLEDHIATHKKITKTMKQEITDAKQKEAYEITEAKQKEEALAKKKVKLYAGTTARQVNMSILESWLKKYNEIEEYDMKANEAKNDYWKGQNRPSHELERYLSSDEYKNITDTYNKYYEKVYSGNACVTIKKHLTQDTFQGPMTTTSVYYGNVRHASPVPTCSPFMKQFIEATYKLFQNQQKQINILKGIE